jgi:hypothetical protein
MMKSEPTQGTGVLREAQAPVPHEQSRILALETDGDPDASRDEAGSLAKIRELLFGEQVRETDARLRGLERQISQSIEGTARESTERLERLGRELRGSLDVLTDRVAALEAALREHEERASLRIEALRKELVDRMRHETDALHARVIEDHDKAIAYVDRVVRALEESKMDRETLAALFSEIASRVDTT